MTSTARRRWSKEFQGEIDGIALGSSGPVFVHGYDPPAGGKWIDNVIPGKLGAYDRSSGEELWMSPCEVGYGRGFGSGFGEEDDVVVLGPSLNGHRIARMSRSTGELIGAQEIGTFDQALVHGDLCVTMIPGRLAGVLTTPMVEVWTYSREGERYHIVARDRDRLHVAFTHLPRKRQGVLALDAGSGEPVGLVLEPRFAVIHGMVAGDGLIVLLLGSRSPEALTRGGAEELSLVAVSPRSNDEALPLWREVLVEQSTDELPDFSIALDNGKLYVAHGAMLEVRDALSGRSLGELTMPGLDERVAWQVSDGAGLLAEETRASVFEIPA